MGTKKFLNVALCIILISSAIAFPSKSSSEEDSQQQQRQSLDSDSLEELTQKIQAKGKKPQKLQVTELEPEPEPYDPCLDPKKIGPCKAHVPRFYFNQATGSCDRFSWGGCAKSGNNFRELTQCETDCAKHLRKGKLDVEPSPTSVIETCEKPAVNQGPECEAYIPRWTFDAKEQQCKQFVWGGCGKTENNFATESLCQNTCGEYSRHKGRRGPVTSPMSVPKARETVVVLDSQQQQNADIAVPKPSEDVCSLPSESGMCMAYFEAYYFNKLHNRCELFVYGGCGGNKNRFDTAQDCERACGGDSPVNDLKCSNVECPWALYEHYASMGCSPIYDGEACCPTRYECPDQLQETQNNTLESRDLTLDRNVASTPEPETRMPQKCRYRGKLYSVGENVDEASDTASCRAGCRCTESDPELGPRIICAQIECPEHLSRYAWGPGCAFLYEKGSCCSKDIYCPKNNLTIVEPGQQQQTERPPLAKCHVEGESYYEGQRVWPKTSCSRCLCQRNPANATSLEGVLDCEKIDCGIEIYYSHYLARGCAPVYFEKEDKTTSCCPISWECPDEQQQRPPSSTESDNGNIATTPGSSLPEPPKPPSTDAPLPTPETNKPNSPLTRTHTACAMPKAEGNCKGQRPRFFFNEETQKCEPFTYTGCNGNFNNFASVEDCEYLCVPKATPEPPSPPAKGGKTAGGPGLLSRSRQVDSPPPETKSITLTEVDSCTLPKRVGRCKGFFPRFHYSPEDNECKLFIFGGCKPNANNFYSQESCEATCLNKIPVDNLRTNIPTAKWRIASEGGDSSRVNFGDDTYELRTPHPPVPPTPAVRSSSSEEESPCKLPPRTGRCKAFVPRFYYDTDQKMCKSFTYGGCSGNANNFRSLEECDQRCGTNRRIELHTGPSPGAPQPRWRIASPGDGMTGGNIDSATPTSPSGRNSLPPSAGFTARCKLPKKEGSCHASVRSYYYDAESKSCKLFFYSGCFGNANRFSSREDCENLCKKPLESEGSSTNEAINQPGRPQIHEFRGTESSSARPVEVLEPESQQKEFCKLDPAPGKCKTNQLRFYYDSVAEQCLPFVYSGCDGNLNNFVTERECMSSCGSKPTLEQLSDQLVLSCTFGNKTLPLGGEVGGNGDDYSGDEPPCGVPICQCITPPAVTCVQRMCPEPTTTTTFPPPICPTPTCHGSCTQTVGLDGCPTCDCDDTDEMTEVVVKMVPSKSVKG